MLGNVIEDFKYSQLYGIDLSGGRTDAFRKTKKNIEKLIDDNKKGSIKANLILMLLYPELITQKYNFDEDHLHPKNDFKKLIKKANESEKKRLEGLRDGIPNLQLLVCDQNRVEKNDTSLYDWVVAGNAFKYDPYKELNDVEKYSFSLDTFEDFYSKRRKMLIDQLTKLFDITK